MMSVNILSEKLTKLEEKLIRTYDNKFATFQSEMLMVVENRTNSERFQQETHFLVQLVMKLEEEILNLRQDLQCSQHVQQDLLKKMNNIKNANDIDRKAQDQTTEEIASDEKALNERNKTAFEILNEDVLYKNFDSMNNDQSNIDIKLSMQNISLGYDLPLQDFAEETVVVIERESDSATEIEDIEKDNEAWAVVHRNETSWRNTSGGKEPVTNSTRAVDAKQSFSTSIKEEFILKNTNFPVDDSLKAADDTIEQSTFDCEKNTETSFECSKCGLFFIGAKALEKHFKFKHLLNKRQKRYNCQFCSYSCSGKIHLQRHVRVHTKEKPFQCEVCCKKFVRKSTLKRHVLCTHSQERSHECRLCLKKFSTSAIMKQHIRTVHEKIKLFHCEDCDKAFLEIKYLKEHMLSHMGKSK